MASNFPHIILAGSPRERGRRHGEAAGKQIRVSLDLYAKLFNVYAALSWGTPKRKRCALKIPLRSIFPTSWKRCRALRRAADAVFFEQFDQPGGCRPPCRIRRAT